MWLIVKYKPTSLFSLRKSDSSNSAAKSLIAPSPYSIKMALLNSIITFDSLKKAKENFEMIRKLEIQYDLSEYICVNNCFIKIQKEPHSSKKETNPNLSFDTSIGFREYIYYNDIVSFAINVSDEKDKNFLNKYFMLINYYGKRGCFFQYINSSKILLNTLPNNYSTFFNIQNLESIVNGFLVEMDDFDPKVKFEEVNTYSDKSTKRIKKVYCFKYDQIKSSKNFTLYKKACIGK